MSAHLAAVALGYNVWWVTAIGQEKAQQAMKPLLGIPEELSVLDIMCFGPPAKPPYKRWKKSLGDITNWNRFDQSHFMTEIKSRTGWKKRGTRSCIEMPRTSTENPRPAKRHKGNYRLEDQVGFLLRRAYQRASANLIEKMVPMI